MEGDGSLLAEKEQEEEAKRSQKKAKGSKYRTISGSSIAKASSSSLQKREHGQKGAGSPPRKEQKHSRVKSS